MSAAGSPPNESSACCPVPRRQIAAGLLVIVAVTIAVTAWLFAGGTLMGQDTATFFLPMFSFLGDRLRAGHLPVWNPDQFSGAAFLADPESGWLYWPAMILFTIFPALLAAQIFLAVHLLLAAFGSFFLGRLLGFSVLGATAAGLAYELNGLVLGRSVCCPVYLQTAAWLPVCLIAAELALVAGTWLRRLGWWWLGAFAVSQVIASWLGQGTYYALLVLGGYVLWRGVVAPRHPAPDWRGRLARALLTGLAIVAGGALLAGAAILPRFEFRRVSNLASGYGGDLAWAATSGGWRLRDFDNRLLEPNLTYLGGALFALAIVAVLTLGRRHGMPFWALMAVAVLLLTTRWINPLQRLLFVLLPQFESLHRHWPERATVVLYLAPAMLAGGVITHAGRHGRPPARWLAAALAPPILLLLILARGGSVGRFAIYAACVTSLLIAAAVSPRWRVPTWLAPAALTTVLTVELLAAAHVASAHGPYGGFHRLDAAFFQPDGATRFLTAQSGGPFRVFGYDPVYRELESNNGEVTYYRYQFALPGTRALLVNNLGTLFGVPDIQGYDPLQLEAYVRFMRVLNGAAQEYHGSWVLPTGLGSPLLDMLGVRYVLVPTGATPARPEIATLKSSWATVYRDDGVTILQNPAAFPRAWLVHRATPGDDQTVQQRVDAGTIDLRSEAIVDRPVPGLTPAPAGMPERVGVTRDTPESMRLTVTASSPALLVTSEVAYPAWHAYVDGNPVETVTANVAFRAVPVPAGTHTVEFRYESRALNAGLLLSGIGYIAMIGSLGAIWLERRRRAATAPPRA